MLPNTWVVLHLAWGADGLMFSQCLAEIVRCKRMCGVRAEVDHAAWASRTGLKQLCVDTARGVGPFLRSALP